MRKGKVMATTKSNKESKFKRGKKKTSLLSLTGEKMRDIFLPAAFDHEFRPDLIRLSVTAIRANRRQPYGPKRDAGMCHAVSTWGKGRGVARVQRLTQGRNAAESPPNVGGRRAHPPKVEKIWHKKMNRKQRMKAKLSALAATANKDLVLVRGHRMKEDISFPVVFSNQLEKISRTRALEDALTSIGLWSDVVRAKEGTHIRAGKGKMRDRKYKKPRSILIVVGDNVPVVKAGRNLSGVDVTPVSRLNTEKLAPGGDPGRLTIFTQNAIQQMGGW